MNCGTGAPWWPTTKHTIDYDGGFVTFRSEGRAWQFQLDAGAERETYASGYGWFQTSSAGRAWLITASDGMYIGAGHQGATPDSQVLCGTSATLQTRHPLSIMPLNTDQSTLTCRRRASFPAGNFDEQIGDTFRLEGGALVRGSTTVRLLGFEAPMIPVGSPAPTEARFVYPQGIYAYVITLDATKRIATYSYRTPNFVEECG